MLRTERAPSARPKRPGDARFAISFLRLGCGVTPALHLSAAYYHYTQNRSASTQFQPAAVRLGSGNSDVVAVVADHALSTRISVFLEGDATVARNGAVGRETEYWGPAPLTDISRSTRIGVKLGMRHQF